jgi:hypothetical protein
MAQGLSSNEMDKIIDQLLGPLTNLELSDLIGMDKLQANDRIDELVKDLLVVMYLNITV